MHQKAISMSSSRMATLAKQIQSDTLKLDAYLEQNNLPKPSLGEDAPLIVPLPPDIAAIKENLTAAIDELKWLNHGPIETVFEKSVGASSMALLSSNGVP